MGATYALDVDKSSGAIAFASRELKRYLRSMLGSVRFVSAEGGSQSSPGFVLTEAQKRPDVIPARKVRDGGDLDQIFIVSHGNRLLLAGNNPRSVLFAVYDFLERMGAKWLHPGPGGEVIPKLKRLKLSGWSVTHTASYRYRGVCVEGAFTPRHATAFIDWMAKKKMNHLFMQFENATFWYRRMAPELKVSQAIEWDKEITAAVKKRGLMLEWFGHGWNHNAIGKRAVGLEKAYKVPDGIKPLIAQINGKRAWYYNHPLGTQLCLTNPEARKKVMAYVERQLRSNPHIDVFGFWLADGANNQCECRRCRKFRLSEMYADYVNEVAEIAHAVRPDAKVEFLAYFNTLEPPVRVPVKNPYGNLILMLAPLGRCYCHRLHDPTSAVTEEIPVFPVLNKQPRLLNANFVRLFEGWRKYYKGDTYLFDYHMLGLTYDFLGGNIPEIVSRDVKDLKKHGFDGYVGCQTMRCFWPSGLGMKVISETLWDRRKPYRRIRCEHLRDWFGSAAEAAGEAMDAMYSAARRMRRAHGKEPTEGQLRRSRAALEETAASLRQFGKRQKIRTAGRRIRFLADHAEFLSDQMVLGMGESVTPEESEAAGKRIAGFFMQHASDAEFLLDVQYHGKRFL